MMVVWFLSQKAPSQPPPVSQDEVWCKSKGHVSYYVYLDQYENGYLLKSDVGSDDDRDHTSLGCQLQGFLLPHCQPQSKHTTNDINKPCLTLDICIAEHNVI